MLGRMSNKTYLLIDALKNEVVQHRTRKKKYHPQKQIIINKIKQKIGANGLHDFREYKYVKTSSKYNIT